jgi:hypothetical protein
MAFLVLGCSCDCKFDDGNDRTAAHSASKNASLKVIGQFVSLALSLAFEYGRRGNVECMTL